MSPSSTPRVSVIIPTFNRASLVCEAVDSVLNQSYQDYEIIVIDDGSTDDTDAAVAKYGERVRCVRQDNRGLSAARNLAVGLARGEYLAPLDSDDLWMPFKLELMVALLDRFPEVGFAFSDFSHLHTDGGIENGGLRSWHGRAHVWEVVFERTHPWSELKLQPVAGLPRTDFNVYVGDIYRHSLAEHWVNPCSTLIRATAIQSGQPFPEIDAWSGDPEFYARLSRRCGALFVGLETVYNRSHDDAIRLTHGDPLGQVSSRIALIDRVWRADPEFMQSHAGEVDAAQYVQLMRLARLQVVAGQRAPARRSLRRAAALARGSDKVLRQLLLVAALVPGSQHVIRGLRSLRDARHHTQSGAIRD